MSGEAPEIIANLPPWMQGAANALTLFGIAVIGILQYFKSRKAERKQDDEPEPFDPDDLLDASPVRRFLSNVDRLAECAPLQVEALKTISAAATALAKTIEEDFSEQRVHREVERRLKIERDRRSD